jgi:hypothetical protein
MKNFNFNDVKEWSQWLLETDEFIYVPMLDKFKSTNDDEYFSWEDLWELYHKNFRYN